MKNGHVVKLHKIPLGTKAVRVGLAPLFCFLNLERNQMLVLSRKCHETIRVGDDVVIHVNKLGGNRVIIGIDAPSHIRIVRGELPVDPSHEPMKGKP